MYNMGVKGKGGIKMEAKFSDVLRVGEWGIIEWAGGNSWRVEERKGKLRKIAYVLVHG